jgi:hypothetical protein
MKSVDTISQCYNSTFFIVYIVRCPLESMFKIVASSSFSSIWHCVDKAVW